MDIAERKRIADAMRVWESVTRREGYDYPMGSITFLKSSLIGRLLDGKPPLEDPPPTSFSYPWYDVIEGPGPWLGNEAHQHVGLDGPDGIIINQSLWRIVEHGETKIVSPVFCRKGEVHVRPERYRLTKVSEGTFGWTLEKL